MTASSANLAQIIVERRHTADFANWLVVLRPQLSLEVVCDIVNQATILVPPTVPIIFVVESCK